MNREVNVSYRNNVTHSYNKFKISKSEACKLYYFKDGVGELCFFVNGSLTELKNSQVIFIPENSFSGMIKKSKVRYERCVSLFPKELLHSLSEYDAAALQLTTATKAIIFTLSENGVTEYEKLITELGCSKSGLSAIRLILRQLEILLDVECATVSDFSSSDTLIGNILGELDDLLFSVNSADDIARRLGYSKNYISSYFKNKTNVSLHDILTAKKLFSALMMLTQGASVTEAAYECGFSSASNFISVFKAHYGVTPKRYVKSITEKSDTK